MNNKDALSPFSQGEEEKITDKKKKNEKKSYKHQHKINTFKSRNIFDKQYFQEPDQLESSKHGSNHNSNKKKKGSLYKHSCKS